MLMASYKFWFRISLLICLIKCHRGYTCSNKLIEVLGQTASLIRPVFASVLPTYNDFRKNLKVNTSVKLLTTTDYLTTGLVGEVNPKAAVVFGATSANFTLHNNEAKFPFLAQ